MPTNTVRLHRVLRAPPDRLYRAFVEPSAFERWLPPFGFTGKVHSMEPVVGGAWRMSSPTSAAATATRSAGSTWNWSPASASCTTRRSTTPTCRAP